MNRNYLLIGCLVLTVVAASCSRVRRSPGRAYMPDMYYSRALETYSSTQALRDKGINYTAMPVVGTFARGDLSPYTIVTDTIGLYNEASANLNPLDSVMVDMKEAERLYLVNCAICHGADLKGNGPLFNGGDGPYGAAPANLVGDPRVSSLSEGTMFHVVTYGKGQMGSYAAQLNSMQRWMVVNYVKSKQTGKDTTAAVTAKVDSTAGK